PLRSLVPFRRRDHLVGTVTVSSLAAPGARALSRRARKIVGRAKGRNGLAPGVTIAPVRRPSDGSGRIDSFPWPRHSSRKPIAGVIMPLKIAFQGEPGAFS